MNFKLVILGGLIRLELLLAVGLHLVLELLVVESRLIREKRRLRKRLLQIRLVCTLLVRLIGWCWSLLLSLLV